MGKGEGWGEGEGQGNGGAEAGQWKHGLCDCCSSCRNCKSLCIKLLISKVIHLIYQLAINPCFIKPVNVIDPIVSNQLLPISRSMRIFLPLLLAS